MSYSVLIARPGGFYDSSRCEQGAPSIDQDVWLLVDGDSNPRGCPNWLRSQVMVALVRDEPGESPLL